MHMTTAATQRIMTAGEYLAWEREQEARHEFHHGEIFAMAGGSPRHNSLGAALIRDLGAAVRGGHCRVLTSDQRIAAPQSDRYVYADASVVCGSAVLQEGTKDVLLNPAVVIEVLSKSTELYDRGKKWEGYQHIASLSDYLLVSQSSPRIEHYQRQKDGSWRYDVAEAGGRVRLANGAQLLVDSVYEGVFELEGD